MYAELPGQLALVVVAAVGGDRRDRVVGRRQQRRRSLGALTDQVLLRRDAERPAHRPLEPVGAHPGGACQIRHPERCVHLLVRQFDRRPETRCDVGTIAEVRIDRHHDDDRTRLGLGEHLAGQIPTAAFTPTVDATVRDQLEMVAHRPTGAQDGTVLRFVRSSELGGEQIARPAPDDLVEPAAPGATDECIVRRHVATVGGLQAEHDVRHRTEQVDHEGGGIEGTRLGHLYEWSIVIGESC